MKTDTFASRQTLQEVTCTVSSRAAVRKSCTTAVKGSQRPFCMLCVHCPKCLENPHSVSCDLCAGCRACSLHGRAG